MNPAPPTLRSADRIDLHLHTLASDGAWTPAALVDHLAAEEFRVVAVCDHDTQRSVAEVTRRAARRGITVIPGVEVTTRWNGRQWHLLVYGISPSDARSAGGAFRSVLADLDARLMELAEDARRRIEASGRPLPSLEEWAGGRPLWPYHVLRSTIREGHAQNLKTAAELVVELGGGFSADEPLERVVEAAHQAGGLCVMAHPGRADNVGIMTETDLDLMLQTIPLDGLEAHYRSYTDEQTALYRRLAEERGLLISSGSDSHAPKQPVDPRPWRAAWSRDLLARFGIGVEPQPDGELVWAPGMDAFAVLPKPEPPETEPASPETASGERAAQGGPPEPNGEPPPGAATTPQTETRAS
ncbi:MAG: PHP domain-containing protein [Thermomicrobiales bacterium]|nr:PHP domain-containing protein [Thermomicrobiales bacterium]